jgi:mannonate dehydratase
VPVRVGAYVSLDQHDTQLRFLKQLGVEDVVGSSSSHPDAPAWATREDADQRDAFWTVDALERLRRRVAAAGLRLVAIENPLPPWCCDAIMLGLPDRARQLDHFATTVRNMGAAGVPTLGYNWMVNPPGIRRRSWRTGTEARGRGGAEAERFVMEEMGQTLSRGPLFREREYTGEEMWANYAVFVRTIVPVAAAAGVRLALHPDDPPVARLGGVARLFCDAAGFRRALDLAGSPASGLNFCVGNWTAMGADVPAAIRHFGARGRIVYGHAQGVQGTAARFTECFLDEADCDFGAVIDALDEVGFDGVLLPGHSPRPAGETQPARLGLTFAIGYLRGLLHARGRGRPASA